MSKQETISLDYISSLNPETTIVWATDSVVKIVRERLKLPLMPALSPPPDDIQTLVVIGGGNLIDLAKCWKLNNKPGLRLIAIPSIWGSGAEASPIAVSNFDGNKVIRFHQGLLPNARAIWPELAQSLSDEQIRFGCGDCWSHALEGFLSPLADHSLRMELATLMGQMLRQPSQRDPVWFDWSAQACNGQAQSSVGLVHGIAHVLEGTIHSTEPYLNWGHSRLCSIYLWPVMQFNSSSSSKWDDLITEYGLRPESIMSAIRGFFDPDAYIRCLPFLKEQWMRIIKDPCSRTNSVLVRPGSLQFFLSLEMP